MKKLLLIPLFAISIILLCIIIFANVEDGKSDNKAKENGYEQLSEQEYIKFVENTINRFAEENGLGVLHSDSRAPYLNFELTPVEKLENGKVRRRIITQDEAKNLYELAKSEITYNLSGCYCKRYHYGIISVFIGICSDETSAQNSYWSDINLISIQFDVEKYQKGDTDYWIMDTFNDLYWNK